MPDQGRRAAPGLSRAARRSIERTVWFLDKEADPRQREADDPICAAEALRADGARLVSIPGVGEATAQALRAERPGPALRRGGTGGRRRSGPTPVPLRDQRPPTHAAGQGLYLPVRPALRWNPVRKAFFGHLVGVGKGRLGAVGV